MLFFFAVLNLTKVRSGKKDCSDVVLSTASNKKEVTVKNETPFGTLFLLFLVLVVLAFVLGPKLDSIDSSLKTLVEQQVAVRVTLPQ